MNDNLRKIYDNVRKANTEFNVPYDKFAKDMQVDENRRKFHSNLPKYAKGFNVPYEQFSKDMGFDAVSTPLEDENLEANAQAIEKQETEDTKSGFDAYVRNLESKRSKQTFKDGTEGYVNIPDINTNLPQLKDPNILDNPTFKSKTFEQQANDALMQRANDPDMVVQSAINEFQSYQKWIEDINNEPDTRTSPEVKAELNKWFNENFGVTNDEVGDIRVPQMVQQYLDKNKKVIERTSTRYNPSMMGGGSYEVTDIEEKNTPEQIASVKNWLTNTKAGRSVMDNEKKYLEALDNSIDTLENEITQASDVSRQLGLDNKGVSMLKYLRMSPAEKESYNAEREILREQREAQLPLQDRQLALTQLNELKKLRGAYKEKDSNWVANVFTELGRRLPFDIANSASLGGIGLVGAADLNKALEDPKNKLTQKGYNLVQEYQQAHALDRTIAQDIAQGTSNTLPFIAQFAATGGITSGLAKGAGMAVSGRLGSGIASKVAGRATQDLLQAGARTFLMPQTLTDAYERSTANPENGFLNDYAHSFVVNYIENFSEAVGEYLPDMRWGNPKIRAIMEKSGIQGFPAEFMEEQVGTVLNAALGTGEAEWSDLIDPRNQLVTAGTIALIQAPYASIAAGGYAEGKARNIMQKRSIRKAYDANLANLGRVFGDGTQGIIDEIEKVVVGSENDNDINNLIAKVMNNNVFSTEEKDAIFKYTLAHLARASMEQSKKEHIQEVQETVTSTIENSQNKDTQEVISAKLKNVEGDVNIIANELVYAEDGTVDFDKSPDTIYYSVGDGKPQMTATTNIVEILDRTPTAELVEQANAIVEESINAQMDAEEAPVFELGDEAIANVEGQQVEGVIAQVNPDGYVFRSNDGTTFPIQATQLSKKVELPSSEDYVSNGQETTQEGEQNEQNATTAPSEQNILSLNDIPKDEKGNIQFESVSAENTIAALGEVYEPSDVPGVVDATIANLQKQIEKASNYKPTGDITKDIANKQKSNQQAKDLNERLSYWEGVKSAIDASKPIDQQVSEQLMGEESQGRDNEHLWDVAENSNDVTEIAKAYDEAMEMAGEEALQPWQQELLGRRVNRDSFNMFGDRNYINGAIARSWFNRKDEESNNGSIDLIAKELGVDVQQIIEFIIDHPSNRVKRGNELTEALNARFKDVAKEITGREVGGIESNSAKLLLSTLEYAANNTPSEAETSFAQSDVVSNVPSPVVFFLNDYMRLDEIEDFAQFRNAVEEADALGYFMFPLTPNDKQIILNYIDNAERQTSELQGAREDVSSESVVENGEETINNESDETLEGVDEAQQEVLLPSEEEQQDDTVVSSPLSEKIEAAEAETNTNPTEAQKEAGNYKKGKVAVQGLDISIEQPKGSVRSGVDNDGKEWSVTMNNTYGYFRGTEGKDGDHIDVFVGDNPESERVFVVDQVNQDTSFDEHKVMLGFNSIEDAREAYLANYSEDWQGLGNITEVDIDAFKKWAKTEGRRVKPFAEYKSVKESATLTYGYTNTIFSKDSYEEAKKKDIRYQQTEQKFTPLDDAQAKDLIDILKKTGLAKDVVLDSDIRSNAEIKDAKGNVYGYTTPDGVIHLDATRMNANTPIHEFGHLWVSFIKKYNIRTYNNGKKLIKESPYWKKVNNNPAYANLSEEEKVDEALAMAIGDRGELLKNGTLKQRIVNWLRDLWQSVKNIFKTESSFLEDTTLSEFTDYALHVLLRGESIVDGYTHSINSPEINVEYKGDAVAYIEAQAEALRIEKQYQSKLDLAIANGKARRAFVDQYQPLEALQKIVEELKGKKLQEHENAYMMSQMVQSLDGVQMDVWKSEYMNPIYKAVKALEDEGISTEKAYEYMKVKHGALRNVRLRVRNESKDPNADFSGIYPILARYDYQQNDIGAGEFIQDIEKSIGTEKRDALWESIKNATNHILNTSYNAGVLSKKSYTELKNRNDFYIPLRGWEETTMGELNEYMGRSSIKEAFNSVLRTADGRESEADNPIAFIKMMGESEIMRANKNRMKQSLLNMVRNHKADGLYSVNKIYEILDYNPHIREETWTQVNYKPSDDMFEKGFARQVNVGHKFEHPITLFEAAEHQIIVYEMGEKYVITLNTPAVAQSINGMLNQSVRDTTWISWASGINRFMSAAYTKWNLEFFLYTNFARDWGMANMMHITNYGASYTRQFNKNIPGAMGAYWRAMFGNPDMNNSIDVSLKEFIDNGGETGFAVLKDLEKTKSEIERMMQGKKSLYEKFEDSRVLQVLEKMGQITEGTTRFATYLTSKNTGKSIKQSIIDAKNATVNFNKKGSGETIRLSDLQVPLLSKLPFFKDMPLSSRYFQIGYVFFNASIQGADVVYQAGKRNKRALGVIFASFYAAGVLLSVLGRALMDWDDELQMSEYDKIPEWVRRNNLIIPIGGKDYISLPLPQIFRSAYGIGEMSASFTNGSMKGQNIGLEAIGSITDDISPVDVGSLLSKKGDRWYVSGAIPTMVKPLYEAMENIDYLGRDIAKHNQFNEHLPEHRRVFARTGKQWILLSEMMNKATGGDNVQSGLVNINPAKMEHLMQNYFGGLFKFTDKSVSRMADLGRIIGGEDIEVDSRDIPLVGKMYGHSSNRVGVSNYSQRYYDYLREAEDFDKKSNEYLKQMDYAGFNKFREKHKDELGQYAMIKAYNKGLQKMKKADSMQPDKDTKSLSTTDLLMIDAVLKYELENLKK